MPKVIFFEIIENRITGAKKFLFLYPSYKDKSGFFLKKKKI